MANEAVLADLHAAHPGDAPTPLWADLDHPQPAIGMSRVPGVPLPELDADRHGPALKSLATLHNRIHDMPIPSALAGTPRADSWAHYTRRLTDVWPAQLADAADDPVTRTMLRLLQAWTSRADHLGHIVHAGPPVLSRGDSNLLNWLWSAAERRIRCVDFEFSGCSTVVFDAADLTEHISARGIPDDRWEEILPDLGITPALRPAYESARRTCALRWLAVLWRRRTTRAADFEVQLARNRTCSPRIPADPDPIGHGRRGRTGGNNRHARGQPVVS